MTGRKSNIIGGLSMILLALVLWSQASSSEGVLVTEGIHPMDYPKVLIGILFAIGVILTLLPSKKITKDPIPIISRRTLGMSATFAFFAISLPFVGFAISSFIAASLCAAIMGWKNYKFLALVNATGCICIWAFFTYALKIPLPNGSLW